MNYTTINKSIFNNCIKDQALYDLIISVPIEEIEDNNELMVALEGGRDPIYSSAKYQMGSLLFDAVW